MSKIPYVFLAMPHEFLTWDFLDDPIMMHFIVWMMKRISSEPSFIPLKGEGKQLHLEPFEFMFGRETSALAAGISLKNARTRVKQLIGLGYIKKVASKGASTYSVYSLEVGALRQVVNGRQSGQQPGQQMGQRTGHNLEAQISNPKCIKETSNVSAKFVDRTPFSDQQKSDLQGLLTYCQDKELRISERALRRWIRLYEPERITDHLSLLLDNLDGINKQEAWMEVALKENYSRQNSNIQENRRFAEDFAKSNDWPELKITQSYCCHSPSSKDYPFKLPPEAFREMLTDCYRQYHQDSEGVHGI